MPSLKLDKVNIDLAIVELSTKLAAFENIETSVDFLVDKLSQIFNLSDCSFAIITDQQFNDSDYKLLVEDQALKDDHKIYLPIKIKNKLCAIFTLEFHDTDSCESIYQEHHSLLQHFSRLLSQILSRIQTINDLKASNTKLLRQDQLKSVLICTISHELRTPMANILGFSELINQNKLDDTTLEHYNQEIHNSALRLSNLINNFLDLARVEAGNKLLFNDFEDSEIDWLAENAWSQLKALNSNHEIHWQIEPGLPSLMLDSDAITRVLVNLFNNAIKYSPAKTPNEKVPVTCKIKQKNNEIIVSVIDKGMGIPEAALKQVFGQFFRVESQDTKLISGTGLGLWICQEIIEAHQGRIWCESQLGKGSTFNFTLPIQGDTNNATKILLN